MRPIKGEIPARHTGVLISNAEGEAVAYALFNLEDRGPMFIDPGTRVYQGMIVGEHTRGNDLEVNVAARARSSPTSAPPARTKRAAHPADPHDAGKGARLHRRRTSSSR